MGRDIKELISKMTLEEKCSILSGVDFWHTQSVERLGIEGVMVSDGPHGLRKQDMEADHLGINESIKAVCFPAASATAASFDREMLKEIGEQIGDSCQHEKLAVNLGPAMNIKRSPLCGRNFEYFSEDPYLTGELATALVKGVQSRNVGVSCKHFAMNNQENRRMSSDSVVDERTMREIYLSAFEKVVKEAKPWTIMCSYNRINGVYASENHELLTKILRDEWGFDGYVMSDWGATADRVRGVLAGLDLEMPSSGGKNDEYCVKAVREGKLSEADVDKCVERILTVHERYFENAKPDTVWDKDAQHELAGDMAAQCMVLLKNDDKLLPLKKGEKVAILGEFAVNPRFQGGGSSHINCHKVTTLMDALKDEAGVSYSQGYEINNPEANEELIKEALKCAGAADKVVIIAGLPDSFESEGYDREIMSMPEGQIELIKRVAEVNKNVAVVLLNGSPIEMPWLPDVKAVVEAYLGGQNIGTATKKVLYGDVNPSGRLPESFPVKLEDNPSYLTFGGDLHTDTVVYNEGVFVGYRYYDKKKMDVLFPFGYGLSYTTFKYSNLKLDKTEMKDDEILSVSVDVTNAGDVDGSEVVQLYVSAPAGKIIRPVRELKEFDKITLKSGETKTVTFKLNKRAFAYWDVRIHDWNVESGDYSVCIGKNSREMVLCASVKVNGGTTVKKVYDANSIFADILEDPKASAVIAPILEGFKDFFGSTGDDDAAVSDDMAAAMLKYLPLRGLITFSGGQIDLEAIKQLVDAMNA